MFQSHTASGRTKGIIKKIIASPPVTKVKAPKNRKRKNVTAIVIGVSKRIMSIPLPILPAYICPSPGIIRDRIAASAEFLVLYVTFVGCVR